MALRWGQPRTWWGCFDPEAHPRRPFYMGWSRIKERWHDWRWH